jgi:hypothetical protein
MATLRSIFRGAYLTTFSQRASTHSIELSSQESLRQLYRTKQTELIERLQNAFTTEAVDIYAYPRMLNEADTETTTTKTGVSSHEVDLRGGYQRNLDYGIYNINERRTQARKYRRKNWSCIIL